MLCYLALLVAKLFQSPRIAYLYNLLKKADFFLKFNNLQPAKTISL